MRRIDHDELAALVGEMAALMLTAQDGAWLGRRFNLRRVSGRGRIEGCVTAEGVEVAA